LSGGVLDGVGVGKVGSILVVRRSVGIVNVEIWTNLVSGSRINAVRTDIFRAFLSSRSVSVIVVEIVVVLRRSLIRCAVSIGEGILDLLAGGLIERKGSTSRSTSRKASIDVPSGKGLRIAVGGLLDLLGIGTSSLVRKGLALLSRVGVQSIGTIGSRIDKLNTNKGCTLGQFGIGCIVNGSIVVDILIGGGRSSIGLLNLVGANCLAICE